MKITIIGSGNVATVLGKKILQAGFAVNEVLSLHKKNAKLLARDLGAKAVVNFFELDGKSDMYIIAVSDSAIDEVADNLHAGKAIVVHTSGSVTKNILKKCSENFGALYPLQSLRKEILDLPEIPFLVDGCNGYCREKIFEFAKNFSGFVKFMDDDNRLKFHLCAVVVSNFTNHLYALAQEYCKKQALDFKILLPLIAETTNRLNNNLAFDVQTGPAVREDKFILAKHIAMLDEFEELQKIYKMLSKNIEDFHKKIPTGKPGRELL